jgi:DNA helicase-2/ATP-dependent DNA helicase PcrA
VNGLTPAELTESQRPAYEATEHRVLILGGPGTGKTAIALLMARRILDEEPPGSVRRVLFLTFSRSAATELLQRAPDVLAGDVGGRIDIATFHAFSMGVVNSFRRFAGGPSEPLTILTREEEKLGLATPGAVTFDAIVPSALELLRAAPWLASAYRDRYKAIICDEYQDTSQESADLVEMLALNAQLVCLADADQVIFDWTDDTISRRIGEYRASGAREYDLGYDSRRDPSNVIPRAAAAIRRRAFGDEAIAEACRVGRIRVLQFAVDDEPFDVLVCEVREALAAGARELGVFLATNRSVNDFAERLRSEEIEHEIIGLSGAAGEAQLAIATCARFVTGGVGWPEFLVALGVFVAACYRGSPPPLAVGLAREPEVLDPGLMALLDREREVLLELAGRPLEHFLDRVASLWERLFAGRPRGLWALGARDLRGQVLAILGRPLTPSLAATVTSLAKARRGLALVDDIPTIRAAVRIMNVYQVKGREMDEAFLVHLPGDADQWNPEGMLRLARVHYVSLSRARSRATIILPATPKSFFVPYAGLCRRT